MGAEPTLDNLDTRDEGEPSFETRLLAALKDTSAISDVYAQRAERAYARAGGNLVDVLTRLGLCE